uniref:Alanyl-tRNA synthetase class IIc N-terminal domain-containing protein n=1 Tax=Oryza meridionalis TaxID=40149 RepID=A0A0E0F5W0_9ORYZ
MAASTEWPARRVRETFFSFFESKSHTRWLSGPVVPVDDPTLCSRAHHALAASPHKFLLSVVTMRFSRLAPSP